MEAKVEQLQKVSSEIDPQPFWGMGEVLRQVVPTCLGMVNGVIMAFVDGLMVAHLNPGGPEALSAQSFAGIFAFTAQALMVGALTVVNTYVSQNFGAKRLERCGQYAWQGLYLSALFAIVLVPLAMLSGPIFGWLNHGPIIAPLEAMYFKYMIYGTVLFLATQVLQQFFYGIEKPTVIFAVSVIANAVNFVVAYALIFGVWGMPALGLEGAAIGTLVGTGTGLAVLFAMFLLGPASRLFQTRTQLAPRWREMRELLAVGMPAGCQICVDVLGWTLFLGVLIGSLQTVHGVFDPDAQTIQLAASSVVWRYLPVSFMPAVGIGVATTALVGRYIGEGKPHLAQRRVRAALVLGMLYMGSCGLAFMIWRYPLVQFFVSLPGSVDPAASKRAGEIIAIGGTLMICAAVFQLFDAIGIVFISALRGAGDTLWPAIISMGMVATVLIGGGYTMLHLFPRLESVGVWMAASLYVILIGLVMFLRFHSGRWRKIDLLRKEPRGFPVGPVAPLCESVEEVEQASTSAGHSHLSAGGGDEGEL